MKNLLFLSLLVLGGQFLNAQGEIIVNGAGDTYGATVDDNPNGAYDFFAFQNGHNIYEKPCCDVIYNTPQTSQQGGFADHWIIYDYNLASIRYAVAADPSITMPPATGWFAVDGANPAPTLSGQDAVLPVDLIDFTGRATANSVQLHWRTAWEVNNDYFAVERSADGRRFEQIGKVAGEGNSDGESSYRYVDEAPGNAVNYYRLRQVDYDGKATYHDVISVSGPVRPTTGVWPNPASTTIHFDTVGFADERVSVTVSNASGRVVLRRELAAGSDRLDVSDLAPGTYSMTRVAGDQRRHELFQVE